MIKNDRRRPMVFISKVTGGIVTAVPTTILATGKVARFSTGARCEPTRPPTKTTIELTDNIKAWEVVRSQTFLGSLFIEVV